MTTGGYDFCTRSAVYTVKLGTISIGFPNPIWGTRLASPRSPSKYDYNRNEIVGVEHSFTVFLHGKAASRPFKLISEMEFILRDNTFQLSRGGQMPPCLMPVGAHARSYSNCISHRGTTNQRCSRSACRK